MYSIVLFDLQQDPITEIKYWMNNVYAHSCTKTSKRVIFLVGTHAASFLDQQDFERVHNELLKRKNGFCPLLSLNVTITVNQTCAFFLWKILKPKVIELAC